MDSEKKINFAILGLGGRGSVYAHFIRHYGRELVAVCDPNEEKKSLAQSYGVPPKNYYADEDAFFAQGKLADVLVVSTLDDLHYRQTVRALETGYDILLEKPIAVSIEQCEGLARKANELGRKIVVCHVLRYSPFYGKLKELLDEKICGEIVSVSLTEEIGYYHYAHSYVRGNWRNEQIATPLILAKNCHDLDMICWLVGKNVQSVSSLGGLRYFHEKKAPAGATKYCCDCPHAQTCPYSALRIYHNADYEKKAGLAKHGRLGQTARQIDESLKDKNNLYARCVYRCDNDVCDHQTVQMEFDGGVVAQFQSTAFSETMSRKIVIYCENGKIYGGDDGNVYYQRLGEAEQTVQIVYDNSGYANHSGGDAGIIRYLLDYLERGIQATAITSIDRSIISHKIGFLAEESRKNGGQTLSVQ